MTANHVRTMKSIVENPSMPLHFSRSFAKPRKNAVHHSPGFTIIELLVVIAIIGLLVALIIHRHERFLTIYILFNLYNRHRETPFLGGTHHANHFTGYSFAF